MDLAPGVIFGVAFVTADTAGAEFGSKVEIASASVALDLLFSDRKFGCKSCIAYNEISLPYVEEKLTSDFGNALFSFCTILKKNPPAILFFFFLQHAFVI